MEKIKKAVNFIHGFAVNLGEKHMPLMLPRRPILLSSLLSLYAFADDLH